MSIDRPECPVCHRPVQVEVVAFLTRQVQRQVFQCGAVYDLGAASWPAACPVAMNAYLAAEREIASLRALLDADPTPPPARAAFAEPGQGGANVEQASAAGERG